MSDRPQQAPGGLEDVLAWLRGQREALEEALNGSPLETSLGALVKTATRALGEGTRAAFYLANGEGTSLRHVVGMPAAYAEAVDGFAIGPDSLTCGPATATGRPVLTTDVMTDPLWEPWRGMAERFDYRGCWSFPIHTSAGRYVGTFAVYSRQPRQATPRDRELASLITQTASIIISRHREAEARERAEAHNAFLVRFSDAVRGFADPHAIALTACRLVADGLGAERAHWAEIDWATREYVIGAAFHAPGAPAIAGRFPLDAWEPFTSYFFAGRPVVVGDTQADEHVPPAVREGYARLAVGADIAVPVLIDGQLRCTLAVNQQLPRRWAPEEVALVQGIAGRCWAEVERARAEAALRDSDERHAFLLRLSDVLRAEPDAQAIKEQTVRILAEHMRLDRCYISEVFEQQGFSTVGPEQVRPGLPPMAGVYRLSDYPETTRQLATQPMVVHDAANDPRFSDSEKALLADLPQRALLVAPLRKGLQEVIWALVGAMATPRRWTEGERVLLEEVAERTWAAAERARADAALRESEDRLRLALQAARMGIWTLDLDTDAQRRDANLNRLLGLEPADTTQPFDEFLTHVHPDDQPNVRAAFAASTHGGRPLNVEFRVVWPDGSVRWLRDQGDVFGNAAAGARHMAGACVDVTDRKQAEERLRASETRLRQILASATDFAIFTLDAGRCVTGWSPGAAAVFGHAEAEMIGRSGDEVFTPEDRAAGEPGKEAEQARREGRAADERWHVRKGGERFYASGVMTPLDDGFVKVLRDLTERKRMEDDLRDADRRKDEFLAMLGHELRNPLAPLRGVMEALQRQSLDAEALGRAYAMMDRQVAHLTRLVDDLLDVSRITRGLVELRREAVNLAEVADQAAEMVSPVVEGRGHDLQLSLPRKPLRVEGDATRLTQVLFNLLNNAAKYTHAGGRIWLTAEREGEQAVVRVRDNGSGMKAELVPVVFDLFTQGDRTPDRSQGGLGLGLTLVKRLVELHGGTVGARSEGPGRGSEFSVRLPALPADEPKPAPTRVMAPPPAAAQLARALVIDDNFDVAESLTWMLEGLAQEIKMVPGGQAALELAPQFKPDVIVCDIGMPGMDGYETCRRLRQVPGLEKVVIAAVSGYGGPEDRRKSQEAGFDRHLVKPIGRATLEELVKSAAGA